MALYTINGCLARCRQPRSNLIGQAARRAGSVHRDGMDRMAGPSSCGPSFCCGNSSAAFRDRNYSVETRSVSEDLTCSLAYASGYYESDNLNRTEYRCRSGRPARDRRSCNDLP